MDEFEEFSTEELEAQLEDVKSEIESLRHQQRDLELEIYERREKPLYEAQQKLKRWIKVVQG